jgi:Tol biopolymer transport system component
MRNFYAWRAWLPLGVAVIAAACAKGAGPDSFANGSGGNGSGQLGNGNGQLGSGSSLGGGTTSLGSCVASRGCGSNCGDFSSTPILDGNAQSFTASSSTSGGPCIIEPGDGALLPNNWVRPRFKWTGGSEPFKITIHSGVESNDLVVYTSNSEWTMPANTWAALAANGWDDGSGSNAISVTVADKNGGSSIKFSVAPANANGSMIYWTAAGDACGWSWLEGFGVGDETVTTVLTAPTGPYANPSTAVQWTLSRDQGANLTTTNRDSMDPLTPTGGTQCIGCHVAVPDGNTIAFVDFYPWDGVAAEVDPGNVGNVPTSWLSPGGAETLSQGWLGMMAFSSGLWASGTHRVVAGSQVPSNATNPPWNAGGSTDPSNLIWIDLGTSAAPSFDQNGTPANSAYSGNTSMYYANMGTTYGTIARNGDSNSASCPAWSHDGSNIVYVSNNAPQDGRLAEGTGDLYVVPYNGGMGGDAKPLSGAATSSLNEYYPAFSPDDTYVAFDGAPANKSMYYNSDAEVYVIPSKGGTATRLKANDPPTCMNAPSPGVTNSWPRWSPEHPSCGGKTYYWVIFSSTRLDIPFTIDMAKKNFWNGSSYDTPDGPTSQLYLTAVVDDGSGNLTTFPATYIWNQSTQTSDGFAQSNHTPAWEVVNIPPPPPPK